MKKFFVILSAVFLASASVVAYLWNAHVEKDDEEDLVSDFLAGHNDELLEDILANGGVHKKGNYVVCLGYDPLKDHSFEELYKEGIEDYKQQISRIIAKYGTRRIELDTLFAISPKILDSLVSVEFEGLPHGKDRGNVCIAKNELMRELADLSKIEPVNWMSMCMPDYDIYGNFKTGERKNLGTLICGGSKGANFNGVQVATCFTSWAVTEKFVNTMLEKGNCLKKKNRLGKQL